MQIPAFITVRTLSERLPNKCLLPFGESNVLVHIVKRSKHYDLEPIVCTTVDSTDDIIEEIAYRESVKCFRGSVNHKLKRWLDCCDKFRIDKFHTVDADDPFFDGELIKKSFSLLKDDYNMVYPTKSSSCGGASVGFSLTRDIIAKFCEMTRDEEDTEMMWYYLEKTPGLKGTKLEDISKPVKVRLTLDYEEDYWLLCSIQRIVGNLAPRKAVEDLFRRNPDLYKINWFRNEEWKQRQLVKSIKE
jgi:spore coat polysaccharide biosynthesis protein SpsF (cytidylyltransferase family)